jgi:glutamyl-tRNA synthetase
MESANKPVRVRFAPSPTGELHLGGARTALYDFLFAKHEGGTMVLRVEDTDQKRYVEGSMERFFEDLKWLGITVDEGPEQGGPFAPYIQSERSDRHKEIAAELVKRGYAYYEFGTESVGGAHVEDDYRTGRAVYRGVDRDMDIETATERIAAGESYVVRLKVPLSGTVVVKDIVRGEVIFDLATVDDAVLLKSDGMATYHLAAMVDDHDMEITHVLRSEEWLPSTPKHLLVYQAMDWTAPQFAHLPLLLAQDRKKLSKRIHGSAVWVRTYREEGYLPEAVVNYLALLGWNPGGNDELFDMSQLIERFSLDRVHKAGAMVDQTKLDAFQRHYVQALSTTELAAKLRPFAPADVTDELLSRLTTVAQGRLGKLSEFSEQVSYLLELPYYDGSQLVFRKSTPDTTRTGLVAAIAALNLLDEQSWQEEPLIAQTLDLVVAQQSLSNGDVFWPVRVGLTGQERSPSPAECLWVLGKREGLRRLAIAQEKLSQLAVA